MLALGNLHKDSPRGLMHQYCFLGSGNLALYLDFFEIDNVFVVIYSSRPVHSWWPLIGSSACSIYFLLSYLIC